MTHKKMIFFDIDGTLIDPQNGIYHVPQAIEEMFVKLRKQGVLLGSATGRNLISLHAATEFAFDASVCTNGSMIYIKDQLIYRSGYNQQEVRLLWDYLIERDCVFVMQGEYESFYYHKEHFIIQHYVERVARNVKSKAFNHMPHSEIYKINVFMRDTTQKELIFKELSPNYHLMFFSSPFTGNATEPLSGEITTKRDTKQTGIQMVLDHFKLTPEEALAFGDNSNDIGVFKLIDGYAMSNGLDEVKAVAREVIGDVNSDTIIRTLEKIGVLRP